MLKAILEGIRTIAEVDVYTAMVVTGLVCTAYWLIKVTTDSMLIATVFMPFMVLGALVSNYLFLSYYITPLADKDSNVVLAAATGVIVAMLVMAALTRLLHYISEVMQPPVNPGPGLTSSEPL
ncbi:MAG: hypothetical protein ABL907_23530 [Hyphomicrobium sp.]